MDLFSYIQNDNFEGLMTAIKELDEPQALKNILHKKSGDNLLHQAAKNGKLGMLKLLHVDFGLDLEQSNFDGKRPLHDASQYGWPECVDYIIRQSVCVDCLKRADWTPLMLACTKNNIHVIETLLEAGANPALENKDGWNSFHIACREGHVEIMKLLGRQNEKVWDTVSKNGRTPLHTVALHGKLEAMRYLLANCEYKTDVKDSCGTTPLMDALRGGYIACAECLIGFHKANVFECDNMGQQCIHLASQAECIESLEVLVTNYGADVNIRSTISGITPLHVACKEGKQESVKCLLKYSADPNLKDLKCRTPLHIATGCHHIECVKLLLQHGAIDSGDCNGTFAKDIAVKPAIKELFS